MVGAGSLCRDDRQQPAGVREVNYDVLARLQGKHAAWLCDGTHTITDTSKWMMYGRRHGHR